MQPAPHRRLHAVGADEHLGGEFACARSHAHPGRGIGEIHHAQQWEEGGTTTVDNAVLLCWRHHQAVHQNSITIHHHAGGFIFTKPDGALLGVRRHDGQIN